MCCRKRGVFQGENDKTALTVIAQWENRRQDSRVEEACMKVKGHLEKGVAEEIKWRCGINICSLWNGQEAFMVYEKNGKKTMEHFILI